MKIQFLQVTDLFDKDFKGTQHFWKQFTKKKSVYFL